MTKTAPNIRFKEFTDNWKKQELGKKVKFYSGLTYHPKDVRNNGFFVIRSSNIKDGKLVKADDVFVDSKIAKSTQVKPGDIIVVVRNGSRKLIGKHTQINKEMPDTVIGAFMTGVRSPQNNFINALFDSEKFKQEIHKNLGATINQITIGEFKKMNFCFPTEQEQKSIGNLIKKVNKIISLYQQKLHQLQQLKRGYLQRMFPIPDHSVPQIRFKGFHDKWKKVNLSNIAKITMGQSPSSKNYNNKGNGYVLVQGNDDLKNHQVMPRIWTSQITKIAPANSILLTVRAPVGLVAYTNTDVVIGRGVCSLSLKNPQFLFYLLQFIKFNHTWDRISSGTTYQSINSNNVKDLNVLVPSFPEQQAIGKFLSTFDARINSQKQKIAQLKQFKKFLLQNMFI